jgi:hypothetical protein
MNATVLVYEKGSSSPVIEQVDANTWRDRKANFLRLAIERGCITEGEAHHLATADKLFTIKTSELFTGTRIQQKRRLKLSELVKRELIGL